jgi:hypothetical protein
MKRRAEAPGDVPNAAPDAPVPSIPRTPGLPPSTGLGQRMAQPQTREDVENRYVAARDAWTAAMRASSSGRPADLASLAIAQEAYEAAAAERERWESSGRVAIPVEPEVARNVLEAAVGQELAWRKVRHHEPQRRGIGARLRRLFGGR